MKHLGRVLLVGLLTVFLVGGASATEYGLEGFEDGNIGIIDDEDDYYDCSTISTTQTFSNRGDYSLFIDDGGNGCFAEADTGQTRDYKSVRWAFYVDNLPSGYLRFTGGDGSESKTNNGMYVDCNYQPDYMCAYNDGSDWNNFTQLQADKWYEIRAEFYPSVNKTAFWYNGNLAFNATVNPDNGYGNFRSLILQVWDGAPSYYDDFCFGTETNECVWNRAPEFNSSSVSPDPPLIGETADFSYSASDSDGSIQSVDLVLKDDGSTVFTGSKSSATGTFKPSYSLTQGDITATFTATDNAGATATTTISESLQDTKPEFTIEKPVDNKLQGTTDIQVQVNNFEDNDSKPNEDATVNLKIDGSIKKTFTVEDTEDFTRTVTGKEGSQTLTVEMVENDGDTTSKTRTVEIDTTPPNVTIEKPVEGSRTNSTTGIPLKFTVSDVNLDSSSFEYRKDGGALFQTSGNTTVDFGTIGSHNITVFAEDTLGNRGQDTVQFTADTKNLLTATDKVTNVQLDNIEARFSNGTSVLEKSVNDSSLEFFTSNIPKGDVNFTVSITGFREKTRTLQNIDKSFNQDISVSLERAGLSLNVFNEEKPDTELERTVIFSNSTSKQQLNKTVFPTDYGDVNTESIQEFNSRTYLNQDLNTPVRAAKLIFDTPYFGGGGELEYKVYINGDFEKTVKAFNKDSATVKLDEPKRITSLRLEAENRDDGDTYDESATAQAENFRVKAPDKGRTVIDFNALENSEIPTGQDIEITVEGPENFVTRSYFTDITENSKTTLDAFLLKENQGILMTVEARGPENEPVNDALVTVQFQKDNKFKTVAQKKTASDGSAALRLSPNRQYKLDVKKTGLQSFSGTFSPANYQFDPLKIRLGETNNFQKSNTWDSIEFKLLPRTQKLNESPKLNFSVVDSETGITSFGIKVKNSNGTIIDSSLVSGSSSGGSTTLQPNLSNLNNVEIEGFFVKEEEEYKVERDYQVKRSLSPGVASISNIANSFNTVSQGTRSLLAVLVTGFVAFSLKSRVNKKGGSIVTISTLGLFVLIGWIPAFYWMLSLLAIIGILSIR